MIHRVNMTRIRPMLSAYMGVVQNANHSVMIERHGKTIGAIVSMKDFERIQEKIYDELDGPIDPVDGRRPGRSLILPRSLMWWKD
ncbi:MAG: PHD/YefM family antitoxin component YafN of YafNO toxin-antitoxin module [Halocynthiibacter sp.]|jgi:PHD/YefM family antitoxin component YafN of YafNO toxin-antitoxin module